MDLGESIFAEGQAYIAISRCRNIKGLFVTKFIPNCIIANEEAVKYAKYLEEESIKT